MERSFAITYDYLCPFARNANEAIVEAIESGRQWEVTFRPFSLQQNHHGAEEVPVWDLPVDAALGSGVRALLWSIAVRDAFPGDFLRFHRALFAARHDDAADISDERAIRRAAVETGVDADAVAEIVASGVPSKTLEREHTDLVERYGVFGVPTFIIGDEAVFVRIMERHAIGDIERVVDMVSWTDLNEFKRTRIDR